MSEKITYGVYGYSLLDGDSESLSVMAFTNDLDGAKSLSDCSVRSFGCIRSEVTYYDEDGEEQYVYEILPLDFVVRNGCDLLLYPSEPIDNSLSIVPMSLVMQGKSILAPISEIFPDDIPY